MSVKLPSFRICIFRVFIYRRHCNSFLQLNRFIISSALCTQQSFNSQPDRKQTRKKKNQGQEFFSVIFMAIEGHCRQVGKNVSIQLKLLTCN